MMKISKKTQNMIVAELRTVAGMTPTVKQIGEYYLFSIENCKTPKTGSTEIERQVKEILGRHLDTDQQLLVGVRYSYSN